MTARDSKITTFGSGKRFTNNVQSRISRFASSRIGWRLGRNCSTGIGPKLVSHVSNIQGRPGSGASPHWAARFGGCHTANGKPGWQGARTLEPKLGKYVWLTAVDCTIKYWGGELHIRRTDSNKLSLCRGGLELLFGGGTLEANLCEYVWLMAVDCSTKYCGGKLHIGCVFSNEQSLCWRGLEMLF